MKLLYQGENLRRETAASVVKEAVLDFLGVLCIMVLIGVLFVIMFLM